MNRIKFASLSVIFMMLFLSCKKWKEPANVDFYVDIDKTPSLSGNLTFTGGHIMIENFDFDADRERGDDVSFSQEYGQSLIINFDESSMIEELDFVIPQGVYKRIDIGFETFDDDEDNLISLLVEGVYNYSGGGSAPFRFEFVDSEVFEIRAENESGGDIILDKDVTSPAKIILNPPHWFSAVPMDYFENADLIDVAGVNTLLITKDDNDDIYDIILDRIDESALIIFNY